MQKRVRQYVASVSYRSKKKGDQEESFPVYTHDYETAKSLALAYALQILKLDDFELRIAGA